MEEEIVETGSSLDEKEEESDEQKEEEWIIYPCLPSNKSNSLTHTLFDCPPCLPKEDECYDPMDSFEISRFDELDACYTYGHDAPMNDTCDDAFATVIYDNPCYFDEPNDAPLFMPTIDIHDNKEWCLDKLYDNALDDGPMLLDDIEYNITENGIGEVSTLARRSPIPLESVQSCYNIVKSGFGEVMTLINVDRTILESDKIYVLVNHEKNDACDSYIIEFVHDSTENYYERGKYGCRNIHVTKFPLFMLKVLKLLLFCLPMLVALCFSDLFVYKILMHRKRVRIKCVSYMLLDALLLCFNSYSYVS